MPPSRSDGPTENDAIAPQREGPRAERTSWSRRRASAHEPGPRSTLATTGAARDRGPTRSAPSTAAAVSGLNHSRAARSRRQADPPHRGGPRLRPLGRRRQHEPQGRQPGGDHRDRGAPWRSDRRLRLRHSDLRGPRSERQAHRSWAFPMSPCGSSANMTRPRYDEGFDELDVVRIVKKAFVFEAFASRRGRRTRRHPVPATQKATSAARPRPTRLSERPPRRSREPLPRRTLTRVPLRRGGLPAWVQACVCPRRARSVVHDRHEVTCCQSTDPTNLGPRSGASSPSSARQPAPRR